MKYVERRNGCQPRAGLWLAGLLDTLLPWSCVVCGLGTKDGGICPVCCKHLPWNRHACQQCALPLPAGPDTLCGACLVRDPVFDAAVAPLLFQFPVNRLVHRFKFKRDLATGRILTGLLADQLVARGTVAPDLLLPVPMHRLRLAARGLNPAFEVTRYCARALQLPYLAHARQRHRHTPTQTGLDAASRRRNLRGSFRWRGPDLEGKDVALVDDVMTTGTTLSECARVLKRASAAHVSAWVLARAAHN
ncbi:MAG TPA: ComF family protein [Xanthomonadales bacterium]|nr:ComF family protein [Xanthomonadales bacterium]